MKRKERQVIDKNDIINIIDSCDVCRLGFMDGNIPYIVPMNFGYEIKNESLIFYFHSAREGKKIDCIKNNPSACFEMDSSKKLIQADTACGYTMEYESIIGNGIIDFINNKTEKIKALDIIMKKYAKVLSFEYNDNMLEKVMIFKLTAENYTGKRHKK
jgi:Predicted flavin-nucleotide-binding protein